MLQVSWVIHATMTFGPKAAIGDLQTIVHSFVPVTHCQEDSLQAAGPSTPVPLAWGNAMAQLRRLPQHGEGALPVTAK